jgi:WD40-like Beta Propeller Repeat
MPIAATNGYGCSPLCGTNVLGATHLTVRHLCDISRRATGAGDIYVMNADGTGQTRLTTDPAREFGTAWSPDGTKIAFSRGAAGVHVMNADGSDQHPVHPSGITQAVPA